MSQDTLERYKALVDRHVQAVPAEFQCGEVLRDACAYALEGGKRLRGSILLCFFEALGGQAEEALDFAAALEMIQAYSLVHDDLPCMDDDDFRRGKPSCHKKFGYSTALLAGDALLTAAFEVAARSPSLPPDRVVRGLATLSRAAGPSGMVGGQILDLGFERSPGGADKVRKMYALKTGALFQASARLGAILAGAPQETEDAAGEWGSLFGYAFQVLDDLEDDDQSQKEQDKDTLARETSREEACLEAKEALEAALALLGHFKGRATLAEDLTRRYLIRAT
ncbi:MAG: polyprenyl synthetase family protein [Bacillota bacterium]